MLIGVYDMRGNYGKKTYTPIASGKPTHFQKYSRQAPGWWTSSRVVWRCPETPPPPPSHVPNINHLRCWDTWGTASQQMLLGRRKALPFKEKQKGREEWHMTPKMTKLVQRYRFKVGHQKKFCEFCKLQKPPHLQKTSLHWAAKLAAKAKLEVAPAKKVAQRLFWGGGRLEVGKWPYHPMKSFFV